jgi:hypothetical protein
VTSWTEMVLAALAGLTAFVIGAAVARWPTSRVRGILLGAASGMAAHTGLLAAIGFAANVLPFNQIDYWAAGKLQMVARIFQ